MNINNFLQKNAGDNIYGEGVNQREGESGDVGKYR
jgi:hypothetical protein